MLYRANLGDVSGSTTASLLLLPIQTGVTAVGDNADSVCMELECDEERMDAIRGVLAIKGVHIEMYRRATRSWKRMP